MHIRSRFACQREVQPSDQTRVSTVPLVASLPLFVVVVKGVIVKILVRLHIID